MSSYEQRARERLREIRKTLDWEGTAVVKLNQVRKLAQSVHKIGFGKGKGKEYERRIGKILGEWWQGKPFRPCPCSGGWDKLAGDDEHLASGDLFIPKDSDFPFSVECKKQQQWSLSDLINPNKKDKPIMNWWEQASADAVSVAKQPLLVFSRNHLGYDMVVTQPGICCNMSYVDGVNFMELHGNQFRLEIISLSLFMLYCRCQPKRILSV